MGLERYLLLFIMSSAAIGTTRFIIRRFTFTSDDYYTMHYNILFCRVLESNMNVFIFTRNRNWIAGGTDSSTGGGCYFKILS